MRRIITTTVIGLTFTACAPAEGELSPTNGPVFEADATPAALPMDDLGYEAAKSDLRIERELAPDADRMIRDRLVETDPDCRRVAYMAVRWRDDQNSYDAMFYSLSGRPAAGATGYHAPVGEDGGTFAGHWKSRVVDDTTNRSGPMGGIYESDGELSGQATLDGVPFELTGGWIRLDGQGGVALALVEYCG